MRSISLRLLILILGLLIVGGGKWWWSHSDFVTFQEYEPTANITGLVVTDKRILVSDHYRHHHTKTLELNIGTNMQLLEKDNSIYSNHIPSCQGHITDCRTVVTPQQQQLILVLTRPALNLPANRMTVETVKGHTDLFLTINDTNFPADKDLSIFFDSLRATQFKSVPTANASVIN